MRKSLLSIFAVLLLFTASCKKEVEQPPTVEFELKEKAVMTVDIEEQLKVNVNAKTNIDKTLRWTTSDASIATVSQTGVVTPKRKGFVTIAAALPNDLASSAIFVEVKILNDQFKITPNHFLSTQAGGPSQQTSSIIIDNYTSAPVSLKEWRLTDFTFSWMAFMPGNGAQIIRGKSYQGIEVTTIHDNRKFPHELQLFPVEVDMFIQGVLHKFRVRFDKNGMPQQTMLL